MNWADFKIAIAQGLVASAESVAKIISGATKVGNADKVNGYGSANLLRYRNLFNTQTDISTLMTTGIFRCNAFTSYPPGHPDGQGTVIVINYNIANDDTTTAVQGIDNMWLKRFFISPHTGELWVQTVTSVLVSEWKRIEDGGNADALNGFHSWDFVMFSNYKQYLDSLKADTDNRNVSAIPNDYNSLFKLTGLKNNQAIDLNTPDASLSYVMGIRGWTDSTGGDAHEIAFCGNGKIYHRCGSTDTWKPWSVLMDSNITRPVVVSTTAPTDTTAVWIVP